MKRILYHVIVSATILLCAQMSWGGQVKTYVSGFSVTGYQSKDELAAALRTLLMSRMSGNSVQVVDNPAGADVTVSGSYLVIGKMFSLDAVAKKASGEVVSRAFVQGESQDELIPAVGKLARKLSDDLQKMAVAAPEPTPAIAQQERAPETGMAGNEVVPAPSGDIIRPAVLQKASGSGWVSQRLEGELSGIAIGGTRNGERELFVIGQQSLRYYLQGDVLRLVQEVTFPPDVKVLRVDTADLDGDGTPEVYLTIISGDRLVSQVWVPTGTSLKKVADGLQYFMRAISVNGGEKRLYAQEMAMDGGFYGNVSEVVKSGDGYMLKNPLKLPRFGNLYNFNTFTDDHGKKYVVMLNPDDYLQVFSADGEELWKSSDKYGGSENYFKRPYPSSVSAADKFGSIVFLDQRITVTKDGEIIVPQNGGFWVLGNSRQYSKNSVYSFRWNGAALQEEWHTTESQNYLADYGYDASRHELVGLEVVKKEGLIGNGASVVVVKKTE